MRRSGARARVIEGREYDEIAEELRCSPSLVRKRVSRGLGAMRSKLEELPHDA
jgi:DNA-directed RNA polymerase specialized sigma24 family protein